MHVRHYRADYPFDAQLNQPPTPKKQTQEGRLTAMGSPKQVDLDTALTTLLGKAAAAEPQPQQAFTLDEDF